VRAHVHASRTGTTLHVTATAPSAATARAAATAGLQATLAQLASQWRAEAQRRTTLSHQTYADTIDASNELTLFRASTHPCVGGVDTLVACRPTDVVGADAAYPVAVKHVSDLEAQRAAAVARGDAPAMNALDPRIAAAQQDVVNVSLLRATTTRLQHDITTAQTRSQQVDATVSQAAFVVTALRSAAIVQDSTRGAHLRLTDTRPGLLAGAALLAAIAIALAFRAPRRAPELAPSPRFVRRPEARSGESVHHVDLRVAEERERVEAARAVEAAAAERARLRSVQQRERVEEEVRHTESWVARTSTFSSSPARGDQPAARVTLAQSGTSKPPMTVDVRPPVDDPNAARRTPLIGSGHKNDPSVAPSDTK
jgi:hypothetical protein